MSIFTLLGNDINSNILEKHRPDLLILLLKLPLKTQIFTTKDTSLSWEMIFIQTVILQKNICPILHELQH